MFETTGAASLCARTGTEAGYAISNGAGANLTLQPARGPETPRTIFAKDVPFPMVDPYLPVGRARVPVPGYNAWPGPANRLGKQYYGLAGGRRLDGATPKATNALTKAFAKPLPFSGLGAVPGVFEPGWETIYGLPANPPTMPPIQSPSTGGGINWDNFFGGLFKSAPAIISSATGKYDPLNRTPLQVAQQQQFAQQYGPPPEGSHYNSSGQLVRDSVSSVTDFVTENPLLVGGAILGVVLLFMKSPSGRR